jgi:hypothetical protein
MFPSISEHFRTLLPKYYHLATSDFQRTSFSKNLKEVYGTRSLLFVRDSNRHCARTLRATQTCTLIMMGKAAEKSETGIMPYSKFTRLLTD